MPRVAPQGHHEVAVRHRLVGSLRPPVAAAQSAAPRVGTPSTDGSAHPPRYRHSGKNAKNAARRAPVLVRRQQRLAMSPSPTVAASRGCRPPASGKIGMVPTDEVAARWGLRYRLDLGRRSRRLVTTSAGSPDPHPRPLYVQRAYKTDPPQSHARDGGALSCYRLRGTYMGKKCIKRPGFCPDSGQFQPISATLHLKHVRTSRTVK